MFDTQEKSMQILLAAGDYEKLVIRLKQIELLYCVQHEKPSF